MTNVSMLQGSLLLKEVGRRKDCMTLVGQTKKKSAKGATKNKAPQIHRSHHCFWWKAARDDIFDEMRKVETEGQNIKDNM